MNMSPIPQKDGGTVTVTHVNEAFEAVSRSTTPICIVQQNLKQQIQIIVVWPNSTQNRVLRCQFVKTATPQHMGASPMIRQNERYVAYC